MGLEVQSSACNEFSICCVMAVRCDNSAIFVFFFFFQAEDGIRDVAVTRVQTCALPIFLVSILLLVPTRHWWAYTLAAASAHFLATQQAHWPPLYALHCEAFDAVQNVGAAAGIRILIKSPLKAITLRDAIVFVLIAVVLVPFGTAFWGAAFTVSNGFGTRYWIEWRNLGISNAVTAVVLVPALLLGAHHLFVRRPRA